MFDLSLLVVTPPTVAIWTTLQNYYLFFGIGAGIIVISYMVILIIKNRARPGRTVPAYHEEHGDWGEWKSILLLLCITGSVLAFVEYETFASASVISIPTTPTALHIDVTGRQFKWSFTYPNGYTDYNNLTVPANQIIILNITSADVTHGFFIPALDVGKDAQPGIYNLMWFNATQTGSFTIQCRQLCGVGHALMISSLVVVSPQAYTAWYHSTPAVTTTTSSSSAASSSSSAASSSSSAASSSTVSTSSSTGGA
jgi:cytochrome c oxidase subunit II